MQKITALDFTANNNELNEELITNTALFADYIEKVLHSAGAVYGIGGYNEHRTIYSRSTHFDSGEEPRRLHLGTDIWGAEGTEVFAFIGGMVHSVGYNDKFGDYGATLILQHQLDTTAFYSLYGHISLKDIRTLRVGQFLTRGQRVAHFGGIDENGQWPPHLHFQLINDVYNYEGDFPGVCRFSEREKFLANCPDPDIVLQLNRFLPNQ